MDYTYPSNVGFECSKCGLCCGDTKKKTRRILLLDAEAEKIADQTCKPITDFSTPTNDKQPYSYEMKKTNTGKCIFLKNNQCTIYTLRPLICRFYPFELKFDKNKKLYIFDFTLECPEINQNQNKVVSEKEFKKLFKLAQDKLQ